MEFEYYGPLYGRLLFSIWCTWLDSHKYETSSNDMTYDATWLVKDDHVLLALILCFHLGLSNRHILQRLMQLLH